MLNAICDALDDAEMHNMSHVAFYDFEIYTDGK